MQKKHRIICLHFFLLLSLLSVSAGAAEKKTAYKTINYPGMQTQEVKSLKEKYLSKNYRAWLYRILDESQQYRIFVRNELAKNNMPAILEYLPLVESDYNPNAMSASGAAGLWQFMTNSVAGLLEYNEYVDQRLDPWVSTEAAIKKLKENYRTFGDWLLAITAYNCGAGALNRAIKKAGSRDFWYLCHEGYLTKQASGYVPKLLALADIIENDSFYGLDLPQGRAWNGTTLETRAGMFDYVTVKESISLSAIARELRIDEETFLSLNSALTKKVTPPSRKYAIRFPEGMKESAAYALKEMGFSPIHEK